MGLCGKELALTLQFVVVAGAIVAEEAIRRKGGDANCGGVCACADVVVWILTLDYCTIVVYTYICLVGFCKLFQTK